MIKGFLAVVSNPAVLSGIGSTIVTLPVSLFSSVCFVVITFFTAVNTLNIADNNDTRAVRHGLVGLAFEIASSPGLFAFAQSLVYCFTTFEMLFEADYFRSVVFVFFTLGSLALVGVCNSAVKISGRQKSFLEVQCIEIWQRLSGDIRQVLSNPGLFFPIGNILLLMHDTNFNGLFANWIVSLVFAVGLAFGGYAIFVGILPLFRKVRLSGLSSKSAGLGDLAIGASSLIAGFNCTALATVFWGVSNYMAGVKIGKGRG